MIDMIKVSGLTEDMITPSVLQKLDVIESGYYAISEGAFDTRTVTSTLSYSHSLVYEILENVKRGLLYIVQKLLSLLNNYQINNVKVIQKYRDFVIANIDKIDEPIYYETYEYPDTRGYPRVLRTTNGIERDIVFLQKKIFEGDYDEHKVTARVDSMISYFGKQVIDEYPDLIDLEDSVKRIVIKNIRGKKITINIDKSTINKYFDQINSYKADKDAIQATKKAILEDYEILKRTYADATKPMDVFNARYGNIADATDPEKVEFMNREYQSYASIHMEMIRLFNSYIKIYQTAFNTKLSELQEKIEANRNTIIAVMTRTGVFTSINPKSNPKDNRTIPYNPKFVT